MPAISIFLWHVFKRLEYSKMLEHDMIWKFSLFRINWHYHWPWLY